MAVAPNSPHTRDIASFIYPFTNLAEHEKVEPQMVTAPTSRTPKARAI